MTDEQSLTPEFPKSVQKWNEEMKRFLDARVAEESNSANVRKAGEFVQTLREQLVVALPKDAQFDADDEYFVNDAFAGIAAIIDLKNAKDAA